MSTPEEVRDPDHEWLGCEAMLSVPPFGLTQAGSAPPPDAARHDPETDEPAR